MYATFSLAGRQKIAIVVEGVNDIPIFRISDSAYYPMSRTVWRDGRSIGLALFDVCSQSGSVKKHMLF